VSTFSFAMALPDDRNLIRKRSLKALK
jgi:hypothetical protein